MFTSLLVPVKTVNLNLRHYRLSETCSPNLWNFILLFLLPVHTAGDVDLYMKKWLTPDAHTNILAKELLTKIATDACQQLKKVIMEVCCYICQINQPIKSKLVRYYYLGTRFYRLLHNCLTKVKSTNWNTLSPKTSQELNRPSVRRQNSNFYARSSRKTRKPKSQPYMSD